MPELLIRLRKTAMADNANLDPFTLGIGHIEGPTAIPHTTGRFTVLGGMVPFLLSERFKASGSDLISGTKVVIRFAVRLDGYGGLAKDACISVIVALWAWQDG